MTKTISLDDINLVYHCVEYTLYHEGYDKNVDEDGEVNYEDNDLIECVTYQIPGRTDDCWSDYEGMTIGYIREDDDDLVDMVYEDTFTERVEGYSLNSGLKRRFGEGISYDEETNMITFDDSIDEGELYEVDEDS